jgi:hypothetical protein
VEDLDSKREGNGAKGAVSSYRESGVFEVSLEIKE